MPVKKINFSLPAINQVSAGFSPKQGYPIIKFTIPSQNAILETTTLRLRGRIAVQSTSATYISPSNTLFTAVSDNPDGGDMQNCTSTTVSPFGGVKTVFDKVIIQSKKTQQELTTDNNYSQFIAVKEARFGLKSDFRNSLFSRSLSLGENARVSQRRVMISNVPTTIESSQIGQEFTIKLDVDLLQNTILALDDDHMGGLMISLYLNPESAFFSTFQNGVQTAQTNTIDSFRYILNDLRLEGRYVIPTPQEMSAVPTSLALDTQINLLNDVHSSRSSNSFSPQAQMVKGIVNLYLLQSQTNNYNMSEFSYLTPPGVREVNQQKNSNRFPIKYPLKSQPNYTSTGNPAIGNWFYKSLQTNTTELRLEFEKSITNGKLAPYSSVSLSLTESALENAELAITAPTTSSNLSVDSQGIGIDYSLGLGSTQNFKNQTYSVILDSGVATGNSKLTDNYRDESLLQQTFIRANEIFNSKTLVKVV